MAVLVGREFKDGLGELEETRRAVENAESRAKLQHGRSDSKVSRRNDRGFAQALHREADQLYHAGDYEAALVLYHRAASLFPRDSSHGVAARRTAATISSWNNPSKALMKLLPNAESEARLRVTLCPETAAVEASDILKKSPNPDTVTELLSYFDNHKSFWRTSPSSPAPVSRSGRLTSTKAMLRRLDSLAGTSLKNLEAAFNSGKTSSCLKIAKELLTLSTPLEDPRRYQIPAYDYLSLVHVSLGRHDRAVSAVSRLIRLSKSTGDEVLISRSLVTLGKVHLTFGHLEAAARAWKYLSKDLVGSIPLAWLQHEIGRCHLETGRYRESLEMATRCTEIASRIDCKKWLLHGKLLMGQSLAMMGRLAEALEELKISARITEVEGDTPMQSYVKGLVDQLTRTIRKTSSREVHGYWKIVELRETRTSWIDGIDEDREKFDGATVFTSTEDALITTVFAQRERITGCPNETSSTEESVDADGGITTLLCRKNGPLKRSSHEQDIRSNLVSPMEPGETPRGGSTFRVDDPGTSRGRRDLSLSSASSSNFVDDIEDYVDDEILREESNDSAEPGINVPRISDNEEDETSTGGPCTRSSRTDDTNLTYVVERRGERETGRTRGIEDDGGKGETRTFWEEDYVGKGEFLRNREVSENSVDGNDLPGDVPTIEELDGKNEMELLEILRDLLLTTADEDRSMEEFINPTSARGATRGLGNMEQSRTSRSCDEGRRKVASHSLYRHSLPSSPRNQIDAWYDRENYSGIFETK